ncbi:MAG TPA: glucosamine-6-phosphate deaminase [bacterium]|uniref:Glucosamine-6-phosphate deaminase n=1 Tax=candidate division TA06 bacterium ADurb.Bin417 TaxID=1852828 RepID=A0A1V5MIT5_UNCT6|nr:MAG: Glucosamine-6-phosphate deaminase [candidate division TA06 bacterium ADurb.Bin417]HNS48718.1 glucosamine-6-phosphate deaminase [bacterium]
MKVLILPDEQSASLYIARLVKKEIEAKADLRLGLTPCDQLWPCYQHLVEFDNRKEISFHQVRFFATDEFVGYGPDNPLSNAFFLWSRFLCRLDLKKENVFLLNGAASNPASECIAYENILKKVGGVDLGVVGLGIRGEVGRNEPSSSLGSRCRIKILDPMELERDGRFSMHSSHPISSLTVGVATLMAARKIILVALGGGRAMAIARALEGPLTSMVTASVFQRHPDCTVVLDREATIHLKKKNAYEEINAT